MTENGALVRVRDLKMHFPITQGIIIQRKVGAIKAVDGVSFDILRGETLGLVGESGCGKSTTGRAILQLYRPTAGEVYFEDQNLIEAQRRAAAPDAAPDADDLPGSLCLAQPAHDRGRHRRRAADGAQYRQGQGAPGAGAGAAAGRGSEPLFCQPLSPRVFGGQRQRIGVARALAVQPDFIICDEPISALDVSIQAQIINLLEDLQEEFNLTYLFIAHDLSVVRHISDRMAVMYLGKIVELTDRAEILRKPAASLHPGAALGGAHPRSGGGGKAPAGHPGGRRAQPGQPAGGLQLQHALSGGHGSVLRRGPRVRRGRRTDTGLLATGCEWLFAVLIWVDWSSVATIPSFERCLPSAKRV